MGSAYNSITGFMWIFLFLNTLWTISQSYVEGFPNLDKNSFGPKPKGTIKTIEALEAGDIIDCVDIYKQPAFDNPLIKDLKMRPTYMTLVNKTSNPRPLFKQTWNKFGECPKGTIPIRRTPYNNVTIHRKYGNNDDPSLHEYATVVQHFNKSRGAKAVFNTWTPQVMTRELSISQLWVTSGRRAVLNTVEAGWMVYPELFFDAQTRLFIFWSRKNYKRGCYNLVKCRGAGFVQTDNYVTLGGAVEPPLSVYNGDQTGITISLTLSRDGEWWLDIGDREIGYFPRDLFTSLGEGADTISFGGEIVNLETEGRHTSTTMGSGHFSAEGFKKACFISNIQVHKDNLAWVDPNLLLDVPTRPTCYDVNFGPPRTNLGSHFYFGGPGFSQQCQ